MNTGPVTVTAGFWEIYGVRYSGGVRNIISTSDGSNSTVSLRKIVIDTPWLTMKSMKRKACVSQMMLVRLNVISSVEWTR